MTFVRPRTIIAQLLQLLLCSCLQNPDRFSISAATGKRRLHVCQLITFIKPAMTSLRAGQPVQVRWLAGGTACPHGLKSMLWPCQDLVLVLTDSCFGNLPAESPSIFSKSAASSGRMSSGKPSLSPCAPRHCWWRRVVLTRVCWF